MQQAQGFACCINRTRSTFGEASGVVAMGVGKNDCGRRDGVQSAEPVRPAIDHDPGISMRDQQSAMAPVATRGDIDLASRAKKYEFERIVVRRHLSANLNLINLAELIAAGPAVWAEHWCTCVEITPARGVPAVLASLFECRRFHRAILVDSLHRLGCFGRCLAFDVCRLIGNKLRGFI